MPLQGDSAPGKVRHHPFADTVDPDVFYRSSVHESACAELFAAIKSHGGLLVLTGEPGTGKTMVLRRVARDIERAGGRVLWCSDTAPLHGMGVSLGEQPDATTPGTRREALLAVLEARVRQDGATLVAVDEAQRLEPTELGALRDLAQAGATRSASGTPLAVLLVGQRGLDVSLARLGSAPAGRAFDLRVVLSPLDLSEVAPYVAYRLDLAGALLHDVFDGEAIERVAVYTDGIPRVINQLCDAALRAASTAGLATVSAGRVETSARRLGLLPDDQDTVGGARRARSDRVEPAVMRGPGPRRGRVLAWSAAGVGALVLVAALYYGRQEAQVPRSPQPVLAPTPVAVPERAPGPPVPAAPAIRAPVVNLPVVVELQESVEQPSRDPEVPRVAALAGPVAALEERPASVERPPPRDPDMPAVTAPVGPVATLLERPASVEQPPRDPEVPRVAAPAGPVAALMERPESVERPPPRDPEVPAVSAPAGPVAALMERPASVERPSRDPEVPRVATPAGPVAALVERPESVERPPPRDPEVPAAVAPAGPVAVLVERVESVERPPPRDPEVPTVVVPAGPVAVLVERVESVERPPPRDPEVPAVVAPAGPVAVLIERVESVERPPPRDPEVPAVVAPAGPVAVLVERVESVERPPPRDPEVPAVVAPAGPVAVLAERVESVERPPPRDPEVPAAVAPAGPVAVLVERVESVERPPPRDPEVPAAAAPAGPVAALVERPESVKRPAPRDPEVPAVGRVSTPSQVIPQAPLPPMAGTASQGDRELLDAAESGSLAQARALLAARVSPNARDDTGMTPLMVAVIHGHGEVARLLLDAGADVNARDGSGATALMLAANNDRVGLLQTLLDRRADVNVRTRAGWTALTYAAWKGHPAAARRLLAAGADSALTDRRGWTPLQYATWRAADVTRAGTPDAADPSSKDDPASAAAAHLRYVEVIGLLGKTSAQRTR